MDHDPGVGTAAAAGSDAAAGHDESAIHESGRSSEAEQIPVPGERSRPRHFWWHAAVLGAVLLALVPLFDSEAPAFPDEGIYSAQVDNLSNGSWASERPATDLDADGERSALSEEVHRGDESIPYARRPAYPLLLVPFYELGGTAGMLVTSVLGLWVAAVCAALLAARIRTGLSLPTLWLVGAGSPLVFGAYLVIGHTLAAALAALVLLSLARALDDRRSPWLVPAFVAVVPLVLLRSEGAVFVGAAAVTVAAMSVSFRPRIRIDLRTTAIGVGIGVIGAATYMLEGRLARLLVDSGSVATGSVVSRRDPLSAAWVSLLRPWYGTGISAKASTLLVLLALPLAALLLRLMPRRTLMPVALLVLAAGAAVARQFEPLDLMTGLLAAFPVLGALILLRRRDLQDPAVARLLAVSGIAALVLVLTIYETGGAAEWGGRFFYVLVPGLGVLAVVGMDEGRRVLGRNEALVAGVAIAVVMGSLSVLGLRTNLALRDRNTAMVVGSRQYAQEVVGGRDPLVIVAMSTASGTPRVFWRSIVGGEQVISAGDVLNVGPLLQRLPRTGRTGAVAVTNMDGGIFALVTGPWLEGSGWTILGTSELEGTRYRAIHFGPEREDGAAG